MDRDSACATHLGLPTHEPLDASVLKEFACKRRNGSYVVIPPGPCQIEIGDFFAAICWERRNGHNRAEVSLHDLINLLNRQRLQVTSG